VIKLLNQELVLSGKIDFANAEAVYRQGLGLIQSQSQFPLVVNLAELEQGNTMVLAVLVQWLRKTPNAQGLQFKAVPEKMLKIIQACHLQDDLQLIA